MKRAAEMNSSQLETNVDDTADLSILRKPIKTSLRGLNEARKAYENGTDEVCVVVCFSESEMPNIYECFSFSIDTTNAR